MNFDPGKTPTLPKALKRDILIIGSGIHACFSTGAAISAAIALAESAQKACVSMEEAAESLQYAFSGTDNIFSELRFPFHRLYKDLLSYKEGFEDHGPDFDNRSWAFCREQREAFNKKNKFNKYLFPVIVNHRKLYKLKSMDSRSGYRGVKRIKK